MISLEELEKTIIELESRDTTFATCERLAWLYIVRDHLTNTKPTGKSPDYLGQSEFLQVAAGIDIQYLLGVLDEHLEAIKMLYPKEYEAIIIKLKNGQK